MRDWIVLKLTGERPAGTPSLTKLFGLIERDVRAAHETADTSAQDVSPCASLLLPSRTRRRRTLAFRPLRIPGRPEDMHATANLWLNVRGRYLPQCLLMEALHMASRRPTILIVAEAPSKAGSEDPHTWHVVLPAHGKTRAGLDVYVRAGTPTRPTPLIGKEDVNALLMEVPTLWLSNTCWRPMPTKSTLAFSHVCHGGQACGARSRASCTRRRL